MTAARQLTALLVAVLGVAAAVEPAAGDDARPGRQVTTAAGVGAMPEDVVRLQAELSRRPDDVDVRLRLALALARNERRDDARREARAVLARAPGYHDAALLLARLAAWDARWHEARAYAGRVLVIAPDHAEARLLLADIALWSKDLPGARSAVAALPAAGVAEVERVYRQALLAAAEGDSRNALSLAARVLAIAPRHAGAHGLRRDLSYVRVESATTVEVYPRTYVGRVGVSETLTASLFPGARWSAALSYEYARRFETDNHRVAVRGDWRARERWSMFALLRVGRVHVVPRLTATAELRRHVDRASLAGRYSLELMPWPGRLHRVHATAGAPLAGPIRAEVDAFVGVLHGCDQLRAVSGAQGRVSYAGTDWELGGSAGIGVEVDRGISRALRDNPCAGSTRDLVAVNVAAAAIHVERSLGARWLVRASYGVERHPASMWIHVGGLVVRGRY